GVIAYRMYAASGPLLEVLAGSPGGKLLTLLLGVIVFALCWRSRRFSETQPEFQRMTALVLTATLMVIPMVGPYNQILLFPSIFLLLRHWSQFWNRSGVTVGASI